MKTNFDSRYYIKDQTYQINYQEKLELQQTYSFKKVNFSNSNKVSLKI